MKILSGARDAAMLWQVGEECQIIKWAHTTSKVLQGLGANVMLMKLTSYLLQNKETCNKEAQACLGTHLSAPLKKLWATPEVGKQMEPTARPPVW